MFNEKLYQAVLPLTEAQLLPILQAAEHGMTVADLIADLKAHRWESTGQLYQHFGFTRGQGHSFVNGLCWFLGQRNETGRRLLSHREWMRCWR